MSLEKVIDRSYTVIEELQAEETLALRDQLILSILESEVEEIKIQDFKAGLEWLNVAHPISFEEHLNGKLVLLDFFTYCCINCLHILPKLKEIEDMFTIEDGLVVVGVHSAKFDNEKDSQNIMAAVRKYGITHPVVNDGEGVMWKALGISCWPTMLLLGPNGNPIFVAVGESNVKELIAVIKVAVPFYKAKGRLSSHSLPIATNTHICAIGPLLFPGKVACSIGTCGSLTGRQRLAIADSGHNRIIICWDSGAVQYIIGGDDPGLSDGSFKDAKFRNPQGVAFYDPFNVYVADTENNAIRKIDLSKRVVSTVVGKKDEKGDAVDPSKVLKSPWDLALLPNGKSFIVAAAGSHQLWVYAVESCDFWRNISVAREGCMILAGTGREENRNNAYPHAAAFAQPSGVCGAPECQAVFVADSESSSIRRLDLKDGQVSAVVGGGRCPTDLFCFGDVDGKKWDVRLQHPMGVTWTKGLLYLVDSYNHKVKVVDPVDRSCCTLTISSVVEGEEQFNEPGGLCMSSCENFLYVADTNNHCIKVLCLDTNRVHKLRLDLSKMVNDDEMLDEKSLVELSPNGGTVSWLVDVQMGNGVSLTAGSPQQWFLSLPEAPGWHATPLEGHLTEEVLRISIDVPPGPADEIPPPAFLVVTLFACEGGKSVCVKRRFTFSLRVLYKDSGASTVNCSVCHTVVQSTHN